MYPETNGVISPDEGVRLDTDGPVRSLVTYVQGKREKERDGHIFLAGQLF